MEFYPFKWMEAYEKKYNITKETLEKGIKFTIKMLDDKHNDDYLYIFVKGDKRYYAYQGNNGVWDTDIWGAVSDYRDDECAIQNILYAFASIWGISEEVRNKRQLKEFFDKGNYTIGVKPEDDGYTNVNYTKSFF